MSSAAASVDLDAMDLDDLDAMKKETRRLQKKHSRQKKGAICASYNQMAKQINLDNRTRQKQLDDDKKESTHTLFNIKEASRKRLAYQPRQRQHRLDDVQPCFDEDGFGEAGADDENDRPPSGGALSQLEPTSGCKYSVLDSKTVSRKTVSRSIFTPLTWLVVQTCSACCLIGCQQTSSQLGCMGPLGTMRKVGY